MLNPTEDSQQLDRLGQAIGAYHVASGRTLAFAMVKGGRELAFALHKETVAITPTELSLMSLPKDLGYRIKRRKGMTVKDEIFRRIKHRKFWAAGWLPAIRGFLAGGAGTVTAVDKRLGSVFGRVEPNGVAHIILTNKATVAVTVEKPHPIVRKAVNDVFRGMAPYIKRKLGDQAVKAFWAIKGGTLIPFKDEVSHDPERIAKSA